MTLFSLPSWSDHAVRIAIFYAIAWGVHHLAGNVAGRAMRLSRFTPETRRPRPERQETLRSLIASAITVVVFVVATLAAVGQFVDATTLVWIVGLFSAAFGLGARPLISDFLTGTELTLLAKARFGKAAEMRPRLLALVQERLTEAGIELVG